MIDLLLVQDLVFLLVQEVAEVVLLLVQEVVFQLVQEVAEVVLLLVQEVVFQLVQEVVFLQDSFRVVGSDSALEQGCRLVTQEQGTSTAIAGQPSSATKGWQLPAHELVQRCSSHLPNPYYKKKSQYDELQNDMSGFHFIPKNKM